MDKTKSKLKFWSFWTINAALDEGRLCRQIDDMKRDGLDGVVFHPRYYPGRPPYLSEEYLNIVSRVILHARDTGMAVWLYDENGWPSGMADGELLRENPAGAGQMLALHPGEAPDSWHNFMQAGEKWHLRARRLEGTIDYLNPDVCRHFLELVHERYRDGLEPAAWDYVEAFFTDEPRFGPMSGIQKITKHGVIPWSEHLPEKYRRRFDRDLREDIPFIFFSSADGSHEETRYRFWEFMTDQFCAGFFAPYREWCRREDKLFTGHVKGEEHPLFQVMMNGSCHQIYRCLDMPGIDSLERFPDNEFYPRQAGSAALQFGKNRAMAEVMGGSGWGTRPEDVERKYLWLADHGITDLVIHQGQYRLDSHALRDWPPSNPQGFNWREAYSRVLEKIRGKVDTGPVENAVNLVLTPHRGIMAGYEPWILGECGEMHRCTDYPDTAIGRINTAFLELVERLPNNCHFADERTLEECGYVDGDRILIGDCVYTTVIQADGCRFDDAGKKLLSRFEQAGGRLLKSAEVEKPPSSVISVPDKEPDRKVDLHWKEVVPPVNFLLLEPTAEESGNSRWQTEFEVNGPLTSSLTVEFADDIFSAELDGHALDLSKAEEGSQAVLPASGGEIGRHVLTFQLNEEDQGPVFVWLKGDFRVFAKSQWNEGPDNMIRTAGSWVLETAAPPVTEGEMVKEGWPFARGPFIATGTVELPETLPRGTEIALTDIAADAAEVVLAGRNLGWCWGPDWSIMLKEDMPAGVHSVKIQIIPSTFNHYGPHHYIKGDWHVVSPGSFPRGNDVTAPLNKNKEEKHDGQWRFCPLKLPLGMIWE